MAKKKKTSSGRVTKKRTRKKVAKKKVARKKATRKKATQKKSSPKKKAKARGSSSGAKSVDGVLKKYEKGTINARIPAREPEKQDRGT